MAIEQLIFTDCPRGQGIDPAATGLQIKACSDGLPQDIRQQLSNMCMHQGQAFSISKAPDQAIQSEQEWLSKTSDRKNIPDELLKSFPVIWSYDKLRDDLFALIRVQYLCITYDGRTGNFLAHAIVFNPTELAIHNYNPLTLARSELFYTKIPDSGNSLPKLADLKISINTPKSYKLLQDDNYEKYFPAVVSRLSYAAKNNRPVLICVSNWRHSVDLVDNALDALPPKMRYRTTFCTYENDRTWNISARTAQQDGEIKSRHILVLYGKDSRAFNLRADEYQSSYFIFNFVEHKFSPAEAINQFGVFSTNCLIKNDKDILDKYYHLIEQLGYQQEVERWDALVPVVQLFNKQISTESLSLALKSLTNIVTNSHRAMISLNILMPHIESLSSSKKYDELNNISDNLSTLLNYLPDDVLSDQSEKFLRRVTNLSINAFHNGDIRTSIALINVCGKFKNRLLLLVLTKCIEKIHSSFISSLTADNKNELINFLIENLNVIKQTPDFEIKINKILVLIFHVAGEAGLTMEVWQHIGEENIIKHLAGDLDSNKLKLITELSKYITADNCPGAAALLKIKLIKSANLQGEQLHKALIDTARAYSKSKISSEMTKELLDITEEKLKDDFLHTMVLGRMVEVTQETEQAELFFKKFNKILQLLDDKSKKELQRKLAHSNANYVIYRQIFNDVLPWSEEDSPKKLQRWYDIVLKPYPSVFEVLYKKLALSLEKTESRTIALPLVKELLTKSQYKSASNSSLNDLYNGVLLALPLEPPSDQWSQILNPPSSIEFKPEASARLRILNMLSKIEQLAKKPDWTIEKLPYNDSAWQNDVKYINISDKENILNWCINLFKLCGVTTSRDVKILISFLDSIDLLTIEKLGSVVHKVLIDRDPVTCIIVVTAFVNYALEEANQIEEWGTTVGYFIKQFDKNTVRLFELHMKKRFHKPDKEYEQNLHKLLVAAQLEQPEVEKSSVNVVDTVKKSVSVLTQQSKVSGVINSISRQFQGLIGRSKKYSDQQKEGDK